MATMGMVGTATQMTAILPSALDAKSLATGTIPAVAQAPAIVVEPNTKNAMSLTLMARVVVQVPTKMSDVPVIMSTVGVGGTMITVKAKLLDVVAVVITVIAPPPAVVVKMATTVTADTVTRTTAILHCVANVLLPAIGMTRPPVRVVMVIAVVPSTKSAMYLIRIG
jgi:hypothetical protein